MKALSMNTAITWAHVTLLTLCYTKAGSPSPLFTSASGMSHCCAGRAQWAPTEGLQGPGARLSSRIPSSQSKPLGREVMGTIP